MKSNTKTIWHDLLKMPPFVPGKPLASPPPTCYLCGGETEGQGYRLRDGLGSLFTDNAIAKSPGSQAICGSCSALMSSEGYKMACEKYGYNAYFPQKEGKKLLIANWMFFSHCFSNDGWQKLDRIQARQIMLSPPPPPFVITLASAGKKHVIFRAPINLSTELFSIQLDERTIEINRPIFLVMLNDIESAYSLGLSKDSLVTGQYNQAACLKIGITTWQKIESQMQNWRTMFPAMLQVAAFVAQKK